MRSVSFTEWQHDTDARKQEGESNRERERERERESERATEELPDSHTCLLHVPTTLQSKEQKKNHKKEKRKEKKKEVRQVAEKEKKA